MRSGRFGAAVVAAVAAAAVLAIPQSRSAATVAAPVGLPRVQVELGALERAATPLPVLPPLPATVTPATLTPAPAVPSATPLPVSSVLGGGIPVRVLAAYRQAADLEAAADPACGVDWALLAGIGRIESGHASGGRVDAAGTTRGRILGPVLDGSLPGSMVVTDSDGGVLDGDVRFDRATGPMQFLPSTWRAVGADGNGDGVADPNNVDDAALGAARYLCAGGGDLRTVAGATAALFRYNRSASYGADVLAWAAAYRTGATAVPDQEGLVPTGEPGPQVLAAVVGAPAPAPVVQGPPTPVLPPGVPSISAVPPAPAITGPAPPPTTAPPTTPPTTAPGSTAPSTPSPVTTAPVTPPRVTTAPLPTSPVTTAPLPTSPVTTAPATTAPPTTAPAAPAPVPPPAVTPPAVPATAPPTVAPATVPACPAASTVAASTVRVLPDASGLLLRFTLPPLPDGCRVASATLRIDPGPAAATLTVRRPTEDWPATATAEPASAGPSVVSDPAAGARRLTVTALVAALYAGPDDGLLIQGAGAPVGPVRLTVSFTR